MNKRISNNVQIYTSLMGVGTLLMGVVLFMTFPLKADLANGFNTPIIAFEFATSASDVAFLTGDGEVETNNRQKMDEGHQWDMLFPFFYGGFLGLLLLKRMLNGQRFLSFGLPFAVLIIPFDIYENLTLISMTDALRHNASMEALFLQLHPATWLKWGAIGVAISVLTCGLVRNREYWSAVIGALTSLSIFVCWRSNSQPLLVEIMANSIFLFFVFFAMKESLKTWQMVRVKQKI